MEQYQPPDSVMLPIVPKWNWNQGATTPPMGIIPLPIVPKWNWNKYSQAWPWSIQSTTNRTKVELKLITETEGFERFLILPIVPKWNWNFLVIVKLETLFPTNRTKVELKLKNKIMETLKIENYQSYQSGIETMFQWSKLTVELLLPIVPKWNWNYEENGYNVILWATNRTKVELKLFDNMVIFRKPQFYQSYQSGIETSEISDIDPASMATTNRTKVELKLGSVVGVILFPDYQSYQSGIETFHKSIRYANS